MTLNSLHKKSKRIEALPLGIELVAVPSRFTDSRIPVTAYYSKDLMHRYLQATKKERIFTFEVSRYQLSITAKKTFSEKQYKDYLKCVHAFKLNYGAKYRDREVYKEYQRKYRRQNKHKYNVSVARYKQRIQELEDIIMRITRNPI